MSYNPRYHKKAKVKRLEDAWEHVDQLVFAKLGVTTEFLHHIDSKLYGHIILPGMKEYPKFRMGKGMSPFDEASPLIIFRCTGVLDLWYALMTCREFDWPFTCRSGGHSTAGYSSTSQVVIDMSDMKDFQILPGNRVAVGPGCDFGKFNREMMAHRLHVPTGNCDDVCCGGYVQGGGYGYTSRQFGMQLDCVAELWVMLADGRVVRAAQDENPDLYWAMRGGTGNNFGIVFNIVYQAVEWDTMWGFVLTWEGDAAPEAMYAAQNAYGVDSGLDIGYTGNITTIEKDGVRKPVYMFSGICTKGEEVGMEALAPMLAVGDYTWNYRKTDYYYYLNDQIEAMLPGPPPVEGMKEIKTSAYLEKPMSLESWRAFFKFFVDNIDHTNPFNLIVLEAYGGKINEVAYDATAFIHRNVLMDIYVDAFWAAEDGQLHGFDEAQKWMQGIKEFLAQHCNGHYYQNYPQRDMPNFRWQYWGDVYNSLVFVKQKFDPGNVFNYEQSISPYPQGQGIDRSEKPSLFTDPDITYRDMTAAFSTQPRLRDMQP